MSFTLSTVNAEASLKQSGSRRSGCRRWMPLHSTDDGALELHSCRALSSPSCRQHKPPGAKGQAEGKMARLITQKCNLCAWEKVLPLHRNIQ
jgi:hypothetical protein